MLARQGKITLSKDRRKAPTSYGDINPHHVAKDAGLIADEIIKHLAQLRGAEISVTLEIRADHPDGFADDIVRVIAENSRTLKFTQHDFSE